MKYYILIPDEYNNQIAKSQKYDFDSSEIYDFKQSYNYETNKTELNKKKFSHSEYRGELSKYLNDIDHLDLVNISNPTETNSILEFLNELNFKNEDLYTALFYYVAYRSIMYGLEHFKSKIKTKKLIINLIINIEKDYENVDNFIHCIRYTISRLKEIVSNNYIQYDTCYECDFTCIRNIRERYKKNNLIDYEDLVNYDNGCEYFGLL